MKNIPLPDLYYLENPDLKQLFRIMRISIFLLFFCLFSLMAENSHSQNARVTINRSDAPLESILNEIESQTDYLFIYKEDVNVKMRKTIQVNGKPVSEVLPILLTGSSIGYKMEGNHIILTRDVALAAQQQGVGSSDRCFGRTADWCYCDAERRYARHGDRYKRKILAVR